MTEKRRRSASQRLIVPTSSFDLLEGAAQARERTRILNMVVAAMFAAVALMLMFVGANARLGINNINNTIAATEQEIADVGEELGARKAAGEVSGPSVQNFINDRLSAAELALAAETDIARIISDVTAIPGATVTSMTFTTGGGETPDSEDPDALPAADTGDGGRVTGLQVSGTAGSLQAANAATSALSNPDMFNYISDGEAGEVSCSGSTCTWSWSGTVTDAAGTDRLPGISERVTPQRLRGES